MIEVYSANTPNGVKVTIALEEMGEPYDLHVLNLSAKDQKQPTFLKINPNGRIPAIVDNDGPYGKTLRVFESGAILLYLAEKYGKLLPSNPQDRIDAIAWAFFQTGVNFGWLDRAPNYFGFDMSPYPSVTTWLERMSSRDGVKKGMAALSGS